MQEVKLIEAGNVLSVKGEVRVINETGKEEVLKVGAKVQPGDIILTDENSTVVIQFEDHTQPMVVDESCTACVVINSNDDSLVAKQEISNNVLNASSDNVDLLQQQILDGVDPTQNFDNFDENDLQNLIAEGVDPTATPIFEATAAGGNASQGSSISPVINANLEQVTVTAGFDTLFDSSAIPNAELITTAQSLNAFPPSPPAPPAPPELLTAQFTDNFVSGVSYSTSSGVIGDG